MNLFDPRNKESAQKTHTHNGIRPNKAAWIDNETIMTSGTTKMNDREWMTWDTRNLSKHVFKGDFP